MSNEMGNVINSELQIISSNFTKSIQHNKDWVNGRHLVDISKCILLNEQLGNFIYITLKLVPNDSIDNKHWFRLWPGAVQSTYHKSNN